MAGLRSPGSTNTRAPALIQRLNDTYDELALAMRREHEEQQREIRSAWAEIERERALLREERRKIDAEKARLFFGTTRETEATIDASRVAGTTVGPSPNLSGITAASTAVSASTAPPRRGYQADTFTSAYAQQPPRHAPPPAPEPAPVWITVWPGVHRHSQGKRLFTHQYRTLQQLLERAAHELNCQPVGPLLYTPDGRSVSDLADVKPEHDYIVLPSGCKYREDSVPTALLQKLVDETSSVTRLTLA